MPSRFWRALGNNALKPGKGVLIAAAIAWTPPSAAITLAAWFDPSDITTLFKDTAGTVPVTADGDHVLCMKDKSGNNFHVIQNNGAGFEPIYRTGGGKPYLELTGASSQWLFTSGNVQVVNASDGSHSAGAAVIFTNNTGTQKVLDSDAATRVAQFLRNSAGTSETLAFTSGASVLGDTGPAITAGAATTLIEVTDATIADEIFVNNVGNGATSHGAGTLQNAAYQIGIGAGVAGSNPMTGKFYGGVIYRGALSSGDRASLHTYLAGKM